MARKAKILRLNPITPPPLLLPVLPATGALPVPPRTGTVASLPVCHGSSDAALIAALASREAAHARTMLVVTAQAADAPRLKDEIAWFAPGLKIALLPDWETLPWDAFSPHDDLISERLSTLHALSSGTVDVVVTAASGRS